MKLKFEKIIYIFLITAVIGLAISYSKIYLFHIMLLILLLSFLFVKVKYGIVKINKLPTRLHYIFYFMLLWYILSVIWSINISYTFIYIFYILCGTFIVLTLIYFINNSKLLDKTIKILGFVFIVEIFLSLLEAFTSFRLPISPYSEYLSWFGRSSTDSLRQMQENVLAYLLGSPTGFQWNPNNLAVTMLIIFPFFLFNKNFKIKLGGVLSIIILIILSGSRGVFIALIVVISIYLLLYRFKRAIALLLISPFLLLLSLNFIDDVKNSNNKKISEAVQSFEILNTYLFDESINDKSSIGARKQLINNGIIALQDTYYIGVGGGGSVAVQEKSVGMSSHYLSMHNFWIEMLVEAGVLFFICFVIWYIYIIFKLYNISKNTHNNSIKYTSSSLFLSLVGFTIGAVSASSVIYLFPMWIMFGLSIVTINLYITKRNHNEIISSNKFDC